MKKNKDKKNTKEAILTFIAKTQNGEYCEVVPGVATLRRNDFVYVEEENYRYNFVTRC